MLRKLILISFLIFTISLLVMSQEEAKNILYISNNSKSNMKIKTNDEMKLLYKYQKIEGQTNFVNVEIMFERHRKFSNILTFDFSDTVFENFEKTFPTGLWSVFDGDEQINGEYFWGVVNRRFKNGDSSAWCADGGLEGSQNLTYYPKNCNSWLVCGPLDFSNANWATVKFSVWLDSQLGHDYLFWMVATDSSNFNGYGMSGNSNGWLRLNFNLTDDPQLGNITGNEKVWIAFLFYSDDDSTEAFEGAYLDDIYIESAFLDTFKTVKFTLKTSDATGLTWDGSNFWCADRGAKQIYKFEIDNSVTKLDSFIAPISNPADLTWDGSYLWNTNISGEIVKFDTDLKKVVDSINLTDKSPYGLTWEGSYLWIADYFNQNLYKLYPSNQWLESNPVSTGATSRLTGLAWDNQFLWLADEAHSLIYKLDKSGTIHDYYLSPGPKPRGLTFDGQNLWCIANNSIYQLETKINEGILVKVIDHDEDNFPEISASVSVRRNNENKFLRNLSKQNFTVFENNYDQSPFTMYPQNSNQFIRFALVLDHSSSMTEQDISDMNHASHNFIDLMEPITDKGAVIKFASGVDTFQTLTGDTALLHQAIDDTATYHLGNGTALYDAIFKGLEQVERGNQTDKKAVVAMTDGKDQSSTKKKKHEIIKYAMERNIEIFTIGLGDSISKVILKDIADSTGGRCYLAPTTGELDSICKDIFQDLTKYKINYLSSRPFFDGSLRNVVISVKHNSESGFDTFQYEAPLNDTIDLWFDSYLVHSDDIIAVPIKVEDLTNRGINSVLMKISYDKDVIDFLRIKPGIVPLESISMNIDSLLGQITIAVACSYHLVGADSLMNLIFHVKGKPGQSSRLHFENAFFNEGEPYVITKDGEVKVDDSLIITGKIGYYPIISDPSTADFDSLFKIPENFDSLFSDRVNTFVDNVKLILKRNGIQDTTITDENGFYKFEKLFRENSTLMALKENDLNDAITPYDASLVLQHFIVLKPFSPYQMIAGNVSGDTTISAYDASLILRYCVGLIDSFPVKTDWTFVPHDYLINSHNWYRAPKVRIYNPLDQSLDNQNFFGIVYGDVSGNWKPAANELAKTEADDFLISHLIVDDIIEFSENRAKLTIGFKDVSDIYAFGFSLKYDPKVLKVMSVSPTKQTKGYSLVFKAEDNIPPDPPSKGGISHGLVYDAEDVYLNIAAAVAEAIQGSGSLVNIEFELVKTSTSNGANSISITSFSLNEFQATDLNKEIILNTVTALPTEFALRQNYPNPFNLQTMIKYQLPEKATVKIEIFNLLGQRVRILINKEIEAGYHQVNWDGQDDFHSTVASGVYICRFQANQFVSNRKMVVLK